MEHQFDLEKKNDEHVKAARPGPRISKTLSATETQAKGHDRDTKTQPTDILEITSPTMAPRNQTAATRAAESTEPQEELAAALAEIK